MATKYNSRYKLTWMPTGKRWRKKYQGKVYYFAQQEGETKASSYQRCLKEWDRKERELSLGDMSEADRKKLLAVRIAEHGYEYNADGETIEKIVVDFPDADLPADGDAIARYGVQLVEDAQGTLTDTKDVPVIRLAEEIKSQVATKKAEAQAGKIAHKTALRFADRLKLFEQFANGDTPLANLTGRVILDYRNSLLKEVEDGKRTHGGAKTQFQAVRQLLTTAYLMGSIDQLPKLLAVKNNLLSFGLGETDLKKERNWADDIEGFKTLLANADSRLKVCLLLMANCGYQQTDISELGQDEVDWSKGRIKRKRCKGRKRNNVPEVDYLLWRETFDLLKEHRALPNALPNWKGSPRAIVNHNGLPLVNHHNDTDAILLAYNRLVKELKLEATRKPLASIRKTSSTLIRRSPYADYRSHFLGHAPDTVADRFYTTPSNEQFDVCIRWLGTQYGVC